MAAPIRGELVFWDNRLRWFPTETLSAVAAITTTTAAVDAVYTARSVSNYSYTAVAAVGSAYHYYAVEHADENDNGTSAPFVAGYPVAFNDGHMRMKFRFRLAETASPVTQATRTKFFHLRDTGNLSMMNIGVWGALTTPTVRVFTDAGTGGAATSNTFTPTEFRDLLIADADFVEVDVLWKSATAAGGNGVCKVWWNDVLVVNVTTHNTDAVLGGFWLGEQSAGNQTQTATLQMVNWQHDDEEDTTNVIADFGEFSEDGMAGLFWVADVAADSFVVSVHCPKTRFGWANAYATILWEAVPPVSFNDGTATTATAQELTDANGGVVHFVVTGRTPDTAHSFKVRLQNHATVPTISLTTASAQGALYTCPSPAIAYPVHIYSYFCSHQDGFSQPQYGLKLINDLMESHSAAYSVLWWGEDVVYCDSRDTAGDVDEFVLPGNDAATGALADDSPIGLIDLHRDNFANEYSAMTAGTLPRLFGYGDHQFHNNYSPSGWPGSATAAPAPFSFITRGDVHLRGRGCITTLFTPAMLNKGGSDEVYRTTRIGKVLLLHVDPLRYRTNSSWFGATQLAWAVGIASSTDASHVVLCCSQPIGDMIWKDGQDCEDDTDWQDDRNELFDALQANSSIRTFGVLSGDAHIIAAHKRFKPGGGYVRTWTKFVGEFIFGPATNNMLSTAILSSFAFPDAPGTPMTDADFDAMESKQGVMLFDRLSATGDGAGEPGYMRAFGRLAIDPVSGNWTATVYSARYMNAPADRVIYNQTFGATAGGIRGLIRGVRPIREIR